MEIYRFSFPDKESRQALRALQDDLWNQSIEDWQSLDPNETTGDFVAFVEARCRPDEDIRKNVGFTIYWVFRLLWKLYPIPLGLAYIGLGSLLTVNLYFMLRPLMVLVVRNIG